MRYNNIHFRGLRYDTIVSQYLNDSGFVFAIVSTSNNLHKLICKGNCNKQKLLNYFFNHKYLPKLNITIEHFKCDGNEFSCTIKVDSLQKLDDSTIKGFWRNKQIDEILND